MNFRFVTYNRCALSYRYGIYSGTTNIHECIKIVANRSKFAENDRNIVENIKIDM